MKTKTEKLLTILSDSREYRAVDLARRTGLKNVSSTVNRLRNQGVVIYTNNRPSKGGKVYRGNPNTF